MDIPVIPFRQGNNLLYVGKTSLSSLIGRYHVDTFDITNNSDGYQRALTESHAKAFARFVHYGETSPTALSLNIREEYVGRTSYDSKRSVLVIPDDVPLELVDGQHRMKGYEIAKEWDKSILDREVGLIISLGLSKFEEAKQFSIINKTQKGVRADLAERFLAKAAQEMGKLGVAKALESGAYSGIFAEMDWRPNALQISDILNADRASPWYKRIRAPNTPKDGTTINDKSFHDSLEIVITSVEYEGLSIATTCKVLNEYWNAIKSVAPLAFNHPEDHVIQKTTGAFALHRLLVLLARNRYIPRDQDQWTMDNFRDVLSRARDTDGKHLMEASFWRKDGYAGELGTSQKTFKLLAEAILGAIETNLKPKLMQRS